jgi:Pyridine nucleotide-disulphide oxidoreductase
MRDALLILPGPSGLKGERMNSVDKNDVVVLGSGTGGKWMARTMPQEGMRTAVVERRYIGGSCVNIACLPTKNVIHTAKVASLARRAKSCQFGPRLRMAKFVGCIHTFSLRPGGQAAAELFSIPRIFTAASRAAKGSTAPKPCPFWQRRQCGKMRIVRRALLWHSDYQGGARCPKVKEPHLFVFAKRLLSLTITSIP